LAGSCTARIEVKGYRLVGGRRVVAHLLAKAALEKIFEIMTKTKKVEVLYYSPKVAYPEKSINPFCFPFKGL
jgi:hypothetical protein